MHLAELRRWHWIAISIVLGFIFGGIRVAMSGNDLQAAENSINTQKQFEASVLEPLKYNGKTYPQWKSMHVVRVSDPGSSTGTSYVVLGQYHQRSRYVKPRHDKSGKVIINYTEHLFRAPSPFRPLNKIAASSTTSTLALGPYDWVRRLAETLHLKQPEEPDSVVHFLEQVKSTHPDLDYSYQWWRRPRLTIVTWVLGSLVVVGGILPFIVSLTTYGKLFPPPREKKVSLRNVSTKTANSEQRKPELTREHTDQLQRVADEMESRLASTATARGAAATAAPAGAEAASDANAPATRQLTGEALQAAPEGPKEEKVFEAKKDDFYPISRGRPKD